MFCFLKRYFPTEFNFNKHFANVDKYGSLHDDEDGPLHYEVYKNCLSDSPINYILRCDSEHNNYVSVNDICLNNLPEDIRCVYVLRIIQLNIDLTVKVCVNNHSGSGSICYFSDTHNLYPCNHENSDACQQCHIPDCPYLNILGEHHFMVTNYESHLSDSELKRAHLAFRVSTNQHVVRDSEEAKIATVELFYHNQDKTGTLTAQVAHLCESWEEQDKVHLVCVMDMNSKVKTLLQSMRQNMCQLFSSIPHHIKEKFIERYVVVVSHPHGMPKVISIGTTIKCLLKKSSNNVIYLKTSYLVETCLGCSGAPVIGPGWSDGGPCYRVHCAYELKDNRKICISKSHWIVHTDARGGTLSCANNSYSDMLESLSSIFTTIGSWCKWCLINPHLVQRHIRRNKLCQFCRN